MVRLTEIEACVSVSRQWWRYGLINVLFVRWVFHLPQMVVSTAVGINAITALIVVVTVAVVVVGAVVVGVAIGVAVHVVEVVGNVVVVFNDIVIKVNVSAIRTAVVGDGSSLH